MDRAKPTILILTTHTGGGHRNLAQALKETLETRYEVVILDPQSPLVGPTYTAASRHFVSFLHWQFALTDNRPVSFCLQRFLALLGGSRFRGIIERVQPDLVIATHAMLSYTTARALERVGGDPEGRSYGMGEMRRRIRRPPARGGLTLPDGSTRDTDAPGRVGPPLAGGLRIRRIPLVFQLTDLGRLHTTWFAEKEADAYLVPTREILTQALEQGIEQKRLHLTGRPTRRQFLTLSPDVREETLRSLGFDPTVFTLFLQGGAMGAAGLERTIAGVLAAETPVQIILACGDNKGLTAHYAGSEHVRVLPFTEQIAPYMASADVIAGKAGASFISESFILGKPFLATSFIPGQETPNLRFIEQHNLGWLCPRPAEQIVLLRQLVGNPGLLAEKMASINAYRVWNIQANQRILPTIDRLLETPLCYPIGAD
jgi:UDP-N-acetylglucosamine:LPS N-acetylglucosamine transferase